MRKVKNIYYAERGELDSDYATGLVLELEDGTWLMGATTDPVASFGPYKPITTPKIMDPGM